MTTLKFKIGDRVGMTTPKGEFLGYAKIVDATERKPKNQNVYLLSWEINGAPDGDTWTYETRIKLAD